MDEELLSDDDLLTTGSSRAEPSLLSDDEVLLPDDQVLPVNARQAQGPAPSLLSDDDVPLLSDDDVVAPQKPAPESQGKTFLREAAHAVLPTAGALPPMAAGMALGAPLGLPGVIGGALIGGIGGSYAIGKVQDAVLKAFGHDDDAQRAANTEAHPNTAFLGGLAPTAAFFGTGGLTAKAFKEITLKMRAIMGAGQAGVQGGMDVVSGEGLDPFRLGASAVVGGALPQPRAVGQKLMDVGTQGASIGRKKWDELVAERLMGRGDVRPGHPGDTESTTNPTDTPGNTNRTTAASQPPPLTHTPYDPGGSQSPTRDYTKTGETAMGTNVPFSTIAPDMMEALHASTERNRLTKPGDKRAPEPEQVVPENVPPPQEATAPVTDAASAMEGIPPVVPEQVDATPPDMTGLAPEAPPAAPHPDQVPAPKQMTKDGKEVEAAPPKKKATKNLTKEAQEGTYTPSESDRYVQERDETHIWIKDKQTGEIFGKQEKGPNGFGKQISENRERIKQLQQQRDARGPEVEPPAATKVVEEPAPKVDENAPAAVDDVQKFVAEVEAALRDPNLAPEARAQLEEGLRQIKTPEAVTDAVTPEAPKPEASPPKTEKPPKGAKGARLKKAVREYLDFAKKRGDLDASIAHIEGLSGDKQVRAAILAHETFKGITDHGLSLEDAIARAQRLSQRKVARKAAAPQMVEVDGVKVQGHDAGDVARKVAKIEAYRKAFDESAPAEGHNETLAQTQERVANGLQKAHEYAKGEPYEPAQKPVAFQWMAKAAQFAKLEAPTPEQHRAFINDEFVLRSEDPQLAQMARDEFRQEAEDFHLRESLPDEAVLEDEHGVRRLEDDDPKVKLEEGGFEDEAVVKGEDTVTAEDVKAIDDVTPKTIDLSDPAQVEAVLADAVKFANDQQKIIDNIIAEVDRNIKDFERGTGTGVRDKNFRDIEAERMEGNVNRTKRLQAFKAGVPEGGPEGIRQADIRAAGMGLDENAVLQKKGALSDKAELIPAREAWVHEFIKKDGRPTAHDAEDRGLAKIFGDAFRAMLKDEGGTFDFKKPIHLYRKGRKEVYNVLKKVFGATSGTRDAIGSAVLKKEQATFTSAQAEVMHAIERDFGHLYAMDTKKGWALVGIMERNPGVEYQHLTLRQKLADKGITGKDADFLVDRAPMIRDLLDIAAENDKAAGIDYEKRPGYFGHMWADQGKALAEYVKYASKHGPDWFKKDRMFDFIDEGLKAGLKLKHENVADALAARLIASKKAQISINTLDQLWNMGIAQNAKKVVNPGPSTPEQIAGKLKAEAKGRAQGEAWHEVRTPDGEKWFIHPDLAPIWKNALEQPSLWEGEGLKGKLFRGWMEAKNTWVPLKLAVSLFHYTHVVANVNVAENLRRTWMEKWEDMPKEFVKNLGRALSDPLTHLPLGDIPHIGKLLPDFITNTPARRFREYVWVTPDAELSAHDLTVKNIIREMGIIAEKASQEQLRASKQLKKAVADLTSGRMDWDAGTAPPRVVLHGVRRAVEYSQGWMFDKMIPDMKITQALRAAEQLVRLRPDLMKHDTHRLVAMDALGKSIDNRYGEMFYNGLFWNKALKDTSIASMLSLGWNLGQVREAGGAIADLVKGRTFGLDTKHPMQQIAADAAGRGGYVTTYIALSMLSAGMISYLYTGKMPTEVIDYIFPKSGGKNPDGSPSRFSTPFNTREWEMFKAHMAERGGGVVGAIGAAKTLLWNKTILSPITDAAANRDFFGNQLADPHAPWYKYVAQMVDSSLGNMTNPISVAGAQRQVDQGQATSINPLKNPMPYIGFGPAPAYIAREPIQQQIAHAFQMYGKGAATRPYEESGTGLVQGIYRAATETPTMAEQKRKLRGELDKAYNTPSEEPQVRNAAIAAVKQKMAASKLWSPQTIAELRPGEGDVYQYGELPLTIQKQLAAEMTGEQFDKYVVKNRQFPRKYVTEMLKLRAESGASRK